MGGWKDQSWLRGGGGCGAEAADYATLSYPLRLRQPEKVGSQQDPTKVKVSDCP